MILRTPLKTKRMTLPNRLVLPPMATSKADPKGHITQAVLEHYRELSRGGGWGLVITEHSFVHPQGRLHDKQISIAEDTALTGLSALADILRHNNTLSCVQINHAGGAASPPEGLLVAAPSAVPHPKRQAIPKALTADEIHEIPRLFADAAIRAKKAGFDAVEIHAAHGYLLSQFYSPLTNKRQDEYGGSLTNRIRLHREVIAAVRRAVGEAYPVLLRFGACDYQPGGCTQEESITAGKIFEQDGIEILDVSGGLGGADNPNSSAPGYFSDLSAPLCKALGIPVILTGGIAQPVQAEELLAAGAASLIGVGRAALKNPQWAAMAMEDKGMD